MPELEKKDEGACGGGPQAQFTETLAQMSVLLASLTTKVTKRDVPEPAKFQWGRVPHLGPSLWSSRPMLLRSMARTQPVG